MQMDLSLILPVMNEEKNVKPLYEEIVEVVQAMKVNYEVIFVDDGSVDSSVKNIKELTEKDKNVRLLIFRRNFGQTAAMSAGIDAAQGDIVMLMDADRQNDPKDIPVLYKKIKDEGYDVVVGWRKNRQDKAINRKIPSVIANFLIRKIGGVNVQDLGCSHKAFRRELIQEVRLYGEMHRFIPLYTNSIGGKLAEVVVNHRPRVAGETKYGIARTVKVLLDLITVKFLMKYSTKPMYFFGGVGVLCALLSFATSALAIIHKLVHGISITQSPLLVVTAVLVILAVNFVLMGLISEMLMRTYFESQNKRSYLIKESVNV